MICNKVLRRITDKWFIDVDYITSGSDSEFKNYYSVYIRYNYKNFIWTDIECSRNQLLHEIYKLKREMVIETKLKPYRMGHSR